MTTGAVSRALRAISDRHGPSAAKSSKARLSGMFRMAIEYGVVSLNPGARLVDADQRREEIASRHGPNADGRPLLTSKANTWEVNAPWCGGPRQGPDRSAPPEDGR